MAFVASGIAAATQSEAQRFAFDSPPIDVCLENVVAERSPGSNEQDPEVERSK